MEPDRFAEEFSKTVFNYLWFIENFITIEEFKETVSEIEKDMLEFATETAKAVVALAVFSGSVFIDKIEDYFKEREVTRRNVFTFLSEHTFKHHTETEDIFAVVLNTCTFIYRLFMFCINKGKQEFKLFAAMCWTELFERELRKEFRERGDWYLFRKYVMENQFVEKGRGDFDLTIVNNFMQEVTVLFPQMIIEDPVQQPNNHASSETVNVEGGCTEELDEPQSDGEAAAFSFGTVDHIASDIPGFNEKSDAVVFQCDNPKAKIVKLAKQPEVRSCIKSVLPSINPDIEDMFLQDSQACHPMKYTEVDHNSVRSISQTEVNTLTLAKSTAIEDSKEDAIQAKSCDGLLDSEIKVTESETFRNIVNSFFSDISGKILQKRNLIKDEQIILSSLQNFLFPRETESPNADLEQFSDKIYVNGECFEKYAIVPEICATKDSTGEIESVGVSDTSEMSPQRNLIKDDQTNCKDPLNRKNTENPDTDKWYVNGQWFDKYVNLPVKDYTIDCNRNSETGGISKKCPEKNPIEGDQTICKDLLNRQATESPIMTESVKADDVEKYPDTLIVNGVCYEKYVYIPENDVKPDCNEEHGTDTESDEECLV